jgi:hypothetical protein
MRRCRICTHAQRNEIESALTSGRTYQDITRLFGVSKQSIGTHKRCISNVLQLFETRRIKQLRQTVTEALKPVVYLSAIEKQRFVQSAILNDLPSATSIAEKSLLYRNFITSCDHENRLFGNYSPQKQDENRRRQTELDIHFNLVWCSWCTLPLHQMKETYDEEGFMSLLGQASKVKGKIFDESETDYFRALFQRFSCFLPEIELVVNDLVESVPTSGKVDIKRNKAR